MSVNINSFDNDFIEAKFSSNNYEFKKKFIIKNK
jgi:hypothetical protein